MDQLNLDRQSPPNFQCLSCRSELRPINESLPRSCSACGAPIAASRDVPLFLTSMETIAALAGPGLAASTFHAPSAYELVVRLKRLAFRDATIGIAEEVDGKVVLDVGCGPNLDLPHLENRHSYAAAYAGVDASAEFAISARDRHRGVNYAFAQADIGNLPFADKSFDTTIVSFVIHHVDGDGDRIMRELRRVTRSTIIIYDHLRSHHPIKSRVQDAYWAYFDGGCRYLTEQQWADFLRDVRVVRRVRTGAIFGHVVKMVCAVV